VGDFEDDGVRFQGMAGQKECRFDGGPDGWADKKSSLIGGKRVALDMPFSRDRIPREDLARK
jgi:hypothetical protein